MLLLDLPLDKVVLPQDEGRVLNLTTIFKNVLSLVYGEPLPPVRVGDTGDGYYYLCDGRHRFVAHVICGRAFIPAEVVE